MLARYKVVQIVKLLTEGLGVRAIARFTNCDPHTVLNVLETIGQKCESFHDGIVRHVTTGSLQLDELWSRVGCSQKLANRRHYDDEVGVSRKSFGNGSNCMSSFLFNAGMAHGGIANRRIGIE